MSAFKPLNGIDGASDMYSFEKFFVNIPKEAGSFNKLLAETIKQVKQMKADGISDADMRKANIAKTQRLKMKLQLMELAEPTKPMTRPSNAKFGVMIEYAHGVITLAFLKAVPWGDDFGIMLADGSMPLIPKDQISGLMSEIANCVKEKLDEKKEQPHIRIRKQPPPPTAQEGKVCCLCGCRHNQYGHNARPLAEGTCCDDCNEKVIDARLGFKLSDCPTTTGWMKIAKRNKNEFIFGNGNSKFIAHYNEEGLFVSAEYWDREKLKKIPEGAILVHKINEEDECPYMMLVEKDYVLGEGEAIVCDYDRVW